VTITPGHVRRAKVAKRSPWTRHEPARELTFITERTLPPWRRTRRRTNWSTRRSPPGRQKSGASIATATGAAGVFAAAASTAARAWFSTPWATTIGWASLTTHHPTAFFPPGSNPATMATQPADHKAHDSSRLRAQSSLQTTWRQPKRRLEGELENLRTARASGANKGKAENASPRCRSSSKRLLGSTLLASMMSGSSWRLGPIAAPSAASQVRTLVPALPC